MCEVAAALALQCFAAAHGTTALPEELLGLVQELSDFRDLADQFAAFAALD